MEKNKGRRAPRLKSFGEGVGVSVKLAPELIEELKSFRKPERDKLILAMKSLRRTPQKALSVDGTDLRVLRVGKKVIFFVPMLTLIALDVSPESILKNHHVKE